MGVEGTRGLCKWVSQLVAPKDFELPWDYIVQGESHSFVRVP